MIFSSYWFHSTFFKAPSKAQTVSILLDSMQWNWCESVLLISLCYTFIQICSILNLSTIKIGEKKILFFSRSHNYWIISMELCGKLFLLTLISPLILTTNAIKCYSKSQLQVVECSSINCIKQTLGLDTVAFVELISRFLFI